MKTQTFVVAAFVSFVAACAADPVETPPAEGTEDTREEAAPSASDPAVLTLLRGGDFRFSLRDSAVLAGVEKLCGVEAEGSEGETARAAQRASCLERYAAEAAGEGVELTPLEDGRLRYVSYGHEAGARVVHIDARVSVAPFEDGVVELTDVEVTTGPKLPPGARLLVEVLDGGSIAMDKQPGAHPRTGDKRLVFHRSAR